MQDLGSVIRVVQQHKKELSEKYGIKKIAIFGSFVRGQQREDSDIDILVEFRENSGLNLVDFIKIEMELEKILGRKVDLVEKGSLKPRIASHIFKEAVYIE